MCVLYDVMMCVSVCNRRKREQENHKQEAEGIYVHGVEDHSVAVEIKLKINSRY